jgi:carboxymethylenebutenolidase
MKSIFTIAIALLLPVGMVWGQDWAKQNLEKSPRHREWVKVKHGDREVNCYITYPEAKDKAPAVLVIHEIFGLSNWAKSMTDQLAEAGYIAIAPDLLSGMGTGGGGTAEIAKGGGSEAAIQAVSALPADQVTADLNAVAEYVTKLPSCNGNLAVCGFCWGGTQTFRYATDNKDLKAAFVFYGESPKDAESIARINCPVYGFYAGNDNRIDSTLANTTELMKQANKTYEPVTYEGAGHGFMRAGEQPNPTEANKKAREEAWERWKELLKKI